MHISKRAALAAVLLAACTLPAGTAARAVQSAGTLSLSDMKSDKLKSIYRREPRAQAAVPKVEAKIAQWKTDPSTAAYAARLEDELNRITMTGPSETEARLKLDVDLLEAAAAAGAKPPSQEELAALQDRYKKFVSELDDTVLVKDYDRLLKRHDRFIRHTSLGLWDKDKIASELDKMEEMRAAAPDMAYGRSESLAGLQNRRLAAVKNLVYLGTYPHEEIFLSTDRRSVGVLEEGVGGTVPLETADLVVQNPDGTMIDLETANNPARAVPFSPPLSLWMKERMLEGRVPAITLRLPDSATVRQFKELHPGTTADTTKLLVVQDIIDGKLDDYLRKNIGLVAATKEAAIIGLLDNFDGDMAQNSFGADGRTPFYMLDPKFAKMSAEDARQEYLKRAEKGMFANAKSLTPELSNKYGDANIPDGPERVRDAWKHMRQTVASVGPNIAYYSTAGAYHGSKTAFKSQELADAGTQAWNKLEYYWPGESVLDWVGVQAIGPDPSENPKGPNVEDSVEQFFSEARTSGWAQTAAMLRAVAPGAKPNPAAEPVWIATVFQKLIKSGYPLTNIVFVEAPDKLTLWSRDAATAYRANVTSDKFYKWPLRFKMLDQPK
jgi:hypothetical protein